MFIYFNFFFNGMLKKVIEKIGLENEIICYKNDVIMKVNLVIY